MIGCNGGLLGAARTSRRGAAVGIWTPNEQVVYQRQNAWIGDASFDSVSLLLHMDGSNGSTTFTDSSKNALSVTANGNAQISTAQSKFGGSSLYLDGSGDYLSVAANSVFEFGASSFTWEAWIYINSLSAVNGLYYYGSGNPNRLQIAVLTDGSFQAYMETASSFVDLLSSASAVTANTWTHLAVSRDGNTWRSFVNGIVAATATSSLAAPAGQSPNIGFAVTSSTNRYCNGYIDDFRITKGIARYTANFTAPTAPFPNA
jgi:hypothetical protein